MKKVLLTSLIIGSSIASFAQMPMVRAESPGGAFDSFDDAKEYSNVAGPDYDLGIYLWADTNSTTIPYYKRDASAAPLAFTDGVLKSVKERTGNGEIKFTVSQPHGLFIPQVGVTFGKGKSLDLTGASSMSLKIGFKMDLASLATATTADGIKVKFSLKDANDVGIDSKGALGGTGTQWQDEIFVVIDKNGKFTIPSTLKNTISLDATTEAGVTFVTVNFNNVGTDIGYEAIYPKLTDEEYITNENCVGDIKGDKGIKGASAPKLGFDATKVAGFALTFLQNQQLAGDCYFKTTLTDLMFSLTEFSLGNTTVGILDEFITDNNNVVSVYDMMGALVATGKLKELNLVSGKLYIVKSGNKSRKIVMN
jgi:hypothetical protein